MPEYVIKNGETYRIVSDHLGSPRIVVNAATGEVVQRLDFQAFGEIIQDSNPDWQPFGFAGGLYDSDTGLVHFGMRDFDPPIGRWTAKDPIGFRGGVNFYAYVDNDPTNSIDPSGLQNDSVSRSLFEAMRRGDSAEIRNILDAADDVLPPNLRNRALQRIKDTRARDLISGKAKRSPSYRSELEEKTFEQLLRDSSEGAKKMCKLIKESERLSEKGF